MIIDFRSRPPYETFMNNEYFNLFDVDTVTHISEMFNSSVAESVSKRSMELYIEEMNEAGIDKAVIPMRRVGGGNNADVVSLLEQYSNRFIGIAGISPLDDSAISEIEKYVINGPCVGIMMEPAFDQPSWLVDDERVRPVFELCQKHNIPVLFTFGGLDGISLEQIDALERTLVAFPEVKITLCHAGWPNTMKMCQLAAYYPNLYLCVDVYLMNVPGFEDYLNAANYMTKNKIIFGSAYPLVSMKDAKDFYVSGVLKKEVETKVLGENALEALNIK